MADDILALVLAHGADKAGLIKAARVPFDPVLRKACEVNTCGQYGANYGCPPHVGGIEECIAHAKEYEDLLLFQTIGALEDSFDVEGMDAAGQHHRQVARAVFEALDMSDKLMLSAGGCRLCACCAVHTNEACRLPHKLIPSLSAYGINVSKTAALAGMKYINGVNTVTFFSALFLPKGYAHI